MRAMAAGLTAAALVATFPAMAGDLGIAAPVQLAQVGQLPGNFVRQAPAVAEPERVTLDPAVFPVGKWPEGLAWDGASLWVSESGQRSIARLDPVSGRKVQELNVGRLPVDMIGDPSTRSIAVLVNTDKKLLTWQDGAGTRTLATLRDCPQALAAGTEGRAGTAYVLVHQNCTSGEPRVIRVDSAGNARGSEVLEVNGNDIAFAGGAAWVVHSGGMVSVVDADTLEPTHFLYDVPAFAWKIEAGESAVFVGGKTEQSSRAPVVARLDAATFATTHSRELAGGELIAGIAVADGLVAAAGNEGTIWVLRADDLTVLRIITAASGSFDPRAIIAVGNDLFVTVHAGQGENGSVLKFSGWQP